MTIQKLNSYAKQLPSYLAEQYDIHEKYDFSDQTPIHTDEYDYYPEEPAIVINGITIYWDADKPYINPAIPEHMAEIKRRIAGRLADDTWGVISIGVKSRKMVCWLNQPTKNANKLVPLPFDNTKIYYDPEEVDLASNKEMQILAKCLFLAKRYAPEYIIPAPDQKPENWEC